jgi:hypothetical protein
MDKRRIRNGLVHLGRTVSELGKCVFFAQQSVEKRSICLWVGRFFIARGGAFGNFTTATEGGIPRSRFPDRRIAPRKTQVTDFVLRWVVRVV